MMVLDATYISAKKTRRKNDNFKDVWDGSV